MSLGDVREQQASARIIFQPVPIASPASCSVCGVPNHEKGFVTFQGPSLNFEFYGTVIFCYNCTREMALVFGFEDSEKVDEIIQSHNKDAIENVNLRNYITALEDTNDGLQRMLDSRNSLVGPAPVLLSTSVNESESELIESDGDDITDSGPDKPELTEVEPDITEPISVEGPSDVLSVGTTESEPEPFLDL